ncbi:MAG: hypothetical protein HYX22_02245 [Candidatus Yanofskybacteria bacterium]|nr:hypothetical protein [Candidatus Yanofskybacteria bacterium]
MIAKLAEFRNLQFISPEYFSLFNFLYILLVVWLVVFAVRYKERVNRTVGSRRVLIGRMLKFNLVVIAVVLPLSILALSRPYLSEGALQFKKGAVEVIFIVDDSVSMWAKDIVPSRLGVSAREIARVYADQILKEGDKASLVIFGKTSLKKLRLSTDFERFYSEILKIGPPESLTGDDHPWDSDIALALTDTYNFLDMQDKRLAYRTRFGKNPPLDFDWETFSWQPDKKSSRIVIFFGDGDYRFDEYTEEKTKQLQASLAEFRRRGLKIYSVGVGTKQGYPVYRVLDDYKRGVDYFEQTEIELKEEGMTRLNRITLNFLSSQTGGSMATIENSTGSAANFLRVAIDGHRELTVTVASEQQKQEFWREFLYAALLIFGLAFLIIFVLSPYL